MKSRFTKVGIAATLAAGLILAPGLSPAQASALEPAAPSSISNVASASGNQSVGAPATSVTTYGMWFLPCDFLGLRLC